MRKLTSLLAALALVVAIAAPAAAATSDSVTESLTVNSTISIDVDVSSINYGALNKNATSAEHPVNVAVSADVPWKVSVVASDFTREGGGGTIPASARTDVQASPDLPYAANAWDYTGQPVASDSRLLSLTVTVPNDTVPGNYTGSITFTISQQ